MTQCKNCNKKFDYLPEETAFYNERKLSYPKLCPTCRRLYRYTSRNDFFLYPRTCASCKKNIISYYSPEKPYVVYCATCYWSDGWDGVDYGIEYDPNKSTFKHIHELHLKVPHLNSRVVKSENSDYTNSCSHNKDCYLSFGLHFSEGLLNSYWGVENRQCCDCYKFTKSELMYWCIDCSQCYHSLFCLNCQNSTDLIGCVDCHNCQSCYLSSNLRNQKYIYKNKQFSKEEYEKKVTPLYTQNNLKKLKSEWQTVIQKTIYAATNRINCENCHGDYMQNCKNCESCFEVIGCENCLYVSDARSVKDSLDVNFSASKDSSTENVYNSWGASNNCSYATACADVQEGIYNIEYCQQCYSSHDLFGCTNLRNKSFCIFNKQYSEEEYKTLKKKIIDTMRTDGTYGEFFSPSDSLFCYNESPAQLFYPLKQEEVIAKGWQWKETAKRDYLPATINELPDDIRKVKDNIIKEILVCDTCEKNYKIIIQELNFYRQMNVPLPHSCFFCRHEERMKTRNPFLLREVQCQKCSKKIETSFSVGAKNILYCEDCYRETIY